MCRKYNVRDIDKAARRKGDGYDDQGETGTVGAEVLKSVCISE